MKAMRVAAAPTQTFFQRDMNEPWLNWAVATQSTGRVFHMLNRSNSSGGRNNSSKMKPGVNSSHDCRGAEERSRWVTQCGTPTHRVSASSVQRLGNFQMFHLLWKQWKITRRQMMSSLNWQDLSVCLLSLCSFIWIAGFCQIRITVLLKWKTAGGSSGWLMVSAGASPEFSHLHPSQRVGVIEVLLNSY